MVKPDREVLMFIWYILVWSGGTVWIETDWNILTPSASSKNVGIAVLQGVAIFGGSPGSRGQQGQERSSVRLFKGVAGGSTQHRWFGTFSFYIFYTSRLFDGFELLSLFQDAVNISELIELAGISDRSRIKWGDTLLVSNAKCCHVIQTAETQAGVMVNAQQWQTYLHHKPHHMVLTASSLCFTCLLTVQAVTSWYNGKAFFEQLSFEAAPENPTCLEEKCTECKAKELATVHEAPQV